jgi:hypothetical protein
VKVFEHHLKVFGVQNQIRNIISSNLTTRKKLVKGQTPAEQVSKPAALRRYHVLEYVTCGRSASESLSASEIPEDIVGYPASPTFCPVVYGLGIIF